jgi:hypothetical protein
MARNGSGVYTLPAGYLATTGASATSSQHNEPLEDLETDMNTARPIVAGGTGATTAAGARSNLDAVGVDDVQTLTNKTFDNVNVQVGGKVNVQAGGKVEWGAGDYVTWVTDEGFYGFEDDVVSWCLGTTTSTYILSVRDETTTNDPNMVINSSTGVLKRSTSRGEFKTDRRSIDPDVILRLEPVSYKSTLPGDEGERFCGFIAEEVAEVFPEASADNGENYSVRALVAALVAKMQQMDATIKQTDATIKQMETRLAALEG